MNKKHLKISNEKVSNEPNMKFADIYMAKK